MAYDNDAGVFFGGLAIRREPRFLRLPMPHIHDFILNVMGGF